MLKIEKPTLKDTHFEQVLSSKLLKKLLKIKKKTNVKNFIFFSFLKLVTFFIGVILKSRDQKMAYSPSTDKINL